MHHHYDGNRNNTEKHDAWLSFSDLFCGLLLVFILLFFFSVYRYLGAQESNDADVQKLKAEMISEQEEVLALYKADAEDQQAALDEQKALIAKTQEELDQRQAQLAERESELASANQTVAERESELASVNQTVFEQESELASANQTVAEQEDELNAARLHILDQQEQLNAQQALLDEQQLRLEEIVGVRKALITELNRQMGEQNIQVQADQATGAIAFESEILFGFDRSELKEEGKTFFSTFMPVYMEVLLRPEFKDYIGEIIVEGHTDQKGNYFHNLQLSQQRAFSVAEFLLRNEELFMDEDTVETLRSLITVNGCADKELIYRSDGTIDEEKSRRVEIKFRLKDQEMIDEMDEILHEDES